MLVENLQLIEVCATITYRLAHTKLHSNIVHLKINSSCIQILNSKLVSELFDLFVNP